jgi:hypothetical protein
VNLKEGRKIMNTTQRTNTFIGAMTLASIGVSGYAGNQSHQLHASFALAVLALAAATSRMKVKLPGLTGNMSVNLPFLLTAIVNLSAAEAVLITILSTVAQCWPAKDKKFKPEQMAFNVSMMALASGLASLVFHAGALNSQSWSSSTLGLILAAATLFLGQTVPVSAIVAISEGKTPGKIWWSLVQMSFPYYVLSAGVSSMVQTASSHLGWELALAVFPVMYAVHKSYTLYFSRLAEAHPTQVFARAANA